MLSSFIKFFPPLPASPAVQHADGSCSGKRRLPAGAADAPAAAVCRAAPRRPHIHRAYTGGWSTDFCVAASLHEAGLAGWKGVFRSLLWCTAVA